MKRKFGDKKKQDDKHVVSIIDTENDAANAFEK